MDKNLIYLAQTDTTVGFLSNDDKKLTVVKNRSDTKKMLKVVDSFRTLKDYTRVPKQYKKLVRNSKNTTFIYPNEKSFRVVDRDSNHYRFIKKFKTIYSTSANKSGEKFDMKFAINNCDVEVIDYRKYYEQNSSTLIKLGKIKMEKIR